MMTSASNVTKHVDLRHFVDNLPGLAYIFRLAPDGHMSFPFASAGIETYYGLRPEDVAHDAMPIHNLAHPEDQPRIIAAIEESARTLMPFHIESRICRLDMPVRWMDVRSTPAQQPDGSILWYGIMLDITERKHIEESLQNSHRALEEAQRIGHIGSWDVDIVNDVLTWSDEIFRIWEINKAKFAATFDAFIDTVHPEDRERVTRVYNESIIDHSLYEVEHRLLFPDGRIKYIFERGQPYYDADGKPIRFIGTSLEITERKQFEEQLALQGHALNQISEAIYLIDREARILKANDAASRMLGYTRDELLTMRIFDLDPNFGPEKWQQHWHELLTQGTVTVETAHKSKEGKILLIEVNANAIVQQGRHYNFALVRDITERKHMELALAEREREFRALAENLPDPVFRYNLEGRRIYVNPAVERMIGIPADQLIGGIPSEAGILSANEGEKITKIIRHVAMSGHVTECEVKFISPDGELRYFHSRYAPEFGSLGEITGVISIARDITERKYIEEKIRHQASYDSLTGLPNRRMFHDRLSQEITKTERVGECLALLFIDLDHFKEINDSLGHKIGDLLLVEVTGRIRHCIREADIVARLGGDEFVVILPQIEDMSHLGRLAQAIVDNMTQPFYLEQHVAYVSASIGIAGYPQDAGDAESLLGCADQAMYAAKRLGRSCFSFFTPSMQHQVQARLQLATDLRKAIPLNQLQVYYQPIVDSVTGEVIKAEALLRWKHPELGMVPPDQFIPIAEEHGLIHEIGDWVFRQAAIAAHRWNANSTSLRKISVNLSPRQFIKDGFDVDWFEFIQKNKIDPASIVIEITEGLLLDDKNDILQILDKFCEAGIQVSLDDFGTGYSAMSYLKKFPINYLKIDRSFVRDLETDSNDHAIIEAIVAMAHKLELQLIAEGVETVAQHGMLATIGCEYLQGYLFAKPMPEHEFFEFVKAA